MAFHLVRTINLGWSAIGAFCLALSVHAQQGASPQTGPTVTLQQLDGKVRVEIDGKLFTEYVHSGFSKPFLYPIVGPTSATMTRNWPIRKDVPGEEHDHLHHLSLWFGHGAVNGIDFWTDKPGVTGRIEQDRIIEAGATGDRGVLRTHNLWLDPDGKPICSDEREIRFHAMPNARSIDFIITIHASNGDVILGDTKEGTMAIRTHPNLRLSPAKEGDPKQVFGHAVNSNGLRDKEMWGKRADWVDYWGPIDGRVVGIAVFDAPGNPRHPTWWMARDYGLVGANPFGISVFEAPVAPKGAGDLRIPAGNKVTFAWGFLFHVGDDKEGKVAECYAEFAAKSPRHPETVLIEPPLHPETVGTHVGYPYDSTNGTMSGVGIQRIKQ